MNYCFKYALIALVLLLLSTEVNSQFLLKNTASFSQDGSSFASKNPDQSDLIILPVPGYTFNSGFEPGVFLTNQTDTFKRFSFQAMPMYAWKQQNIIGEGRVSFNVLKNTGKIRRFSTFLSGRTYFFKSTDDFDFRASRIEVGDTLNMHSPSKKPELLHQFGLKMHYSSQDILGYNEVDSNWVPSKNTRTLKALRLNWIYNYRRDINPYSMEISSDISDEFARAQFIYQGKLNYDSPEKFFEYRLYTGAYVYKKTNFQNNFDGRLGISGITSEQDIFLDHWFIGRNYDTHHMSDQQTYLDQGGFYTNMIGGKSWDWVSAITFKTTMPFDAPIQLYLGIGAFPDLIDNGIQTAYEGGILLAPLPGVLEIAFPILLDQNSLETLNLNTNNYLEKIRFILNFEKLNLYKWPDHPKIPKPWW